MSAVLQQSSRNQLRQRTHHQRVCSETEAEPGMLNATDPITCVVDESETKMGELIGVDTEREVNLSRWQIISR